MRKKAERCKQCKYQAGDDQPHNCDYCWLTGHSRTAVIKRKRDLSPARCPLFEPLNGKKPKSINNWK